MAKKQEHVPETRETRPNREQRRHPEGKPEDQPLARDEPTPEVPDVVESDVSKTTPEK